MLVLAVLIAAGSLFAFTAKKQMIPKATAVYHYISSSDQLEDMQDTTNWVKNDPEISECGSGESLPCTKVYSEDWGDFYDYLNAFEDAGNLVSEASTRKSSSR